MLRAVRPKNARSKRAMEKRAPKVEENPKVALFLRGTTTSEIVRTAMSDLSLLKKPFAVNFTKKNELRPFEDVASLEFFSRKNDSSLFCFGSHSKKRPHNLVIGRTYDAQVLDMVELGIEGCASMRDFKNAKFATGMKPLLVFSGDSFDTHPAYKIVKSLFLDFFRGETIPAVNLGGLDHVISVVAGPLAEDGRPGRVYFRVYAVQLKKSGTRIPRVELEEVGPSIDFSVRRVREPDADVWKHATRRPKQGTAAKRKKEKNVDVDGLGDVYGRVHVGDQKLDVIQTRKMKGLKRARTAAKGRTESEEEE